MKRAVLTLGAAAALGVLSMAATANAGFELADGSKISKCGKIVEETGDKSKVKAAYVNCDKAYRIAEKFIERDKQKKNWKYHNPAGCEWFAYRKKDRKAFRDWFGSGDPIDFKLIYFTKFTGCRS